MPSRVAITIGGAPCGCDVQKCRCTGVAASCDCLEETGDAAPSLECNACPRPATLTVIYGDHYYAKTCVRHLKFKASVASVMAASDLGVEHVA